MAKIEDLKKLLQRQVTRKEFLQTFGLFLLSLVGVGRLLSSFHGLRPGEAREGEERYGESNYGN